MQDDDDDDWFPEDIHEAFKELRNRKVFDASDMYTLADVWGWTWEKDFKNKAPRRWSQEWEVELAVKIMNLVITVGSLPNQCFFVLLILLKFVSVYIYDKNGFSIRLLNWVEHQPLGTVLWYFELLYELLCLQPSYRFCRRLIAWVTFLAGQSCGLQCESSSFRFFFFFQRKNCCLDNKLQRNDETF